MATTKEYEREMCKVEWVDVPEEETIQQIFNNMDDYFKQKASKAAKGS